MIARTVIIAIAPLTLFAVDFTASDFGGSITPIGAGARALGMGGAFTAIADDATANTWNPAGMTQLERPEAAVSGGYYGRVNSFRGDSAHQDDLQLDHVSFVLPLRMPVPQTLAVAWQRQYDFTTSFALAGSNTTAIDPTTDEIDAQATSIDQQGSFAALGLSYAIEPVDGLSVGATVWRWDDDLTYASSYDRAYRRNVDSRFVTGGVEIGHTIAETDTTTRVSVDHGTSVVAGVLWRASPALSLALNLKPRYRLALDERRTTKERNIDVTAATGTTTVTTARARSTLQLPTAATVGAAWRLDDLQTVALDVGWTRWSELRERTDVGWLSPLNPQIDPGEFEDGWSVRLGYERILDLPRLLVVPRIGALYEQLPGAGPLEDRAGVVSTEARTQHWFGATVGLGLFRRDWLVDLGAQLRVAHGIVGAETPPDRTADVRAVIVRAAIAYHF